jgi:hypothetical protein
MAIIGVGRERVFPVLTPRLAHCSSLTRLEPEVEDEQ